MKTVLVTGATGVIGSAIAAAFAQGGYYVYVHCKTSPQKAKELLERLGGKGEVVQCDLRDPAAIKEVFGGLSVDVLVNNAGITRDKLFFFMDEEEWHGVMDANLNSLFYVTKQLLPEMIKRKGGSIVNVASVSGVVGNAGQVNYSASKGGMIAFTKALCTEVGRYGIRVNAVAPGVIESDMVHEVDKNITRMIPLGRFGKPEEVAEVVFFLGDKATYVQGEVINISGGMVR
ncbi:MAG: SDR family oxidoreductase [Campylobacterales bacterium]|nr:SDR family oxidoreductase [Campylobacterales bacterium]